MLAVNGFALKFHSGDGLRAHFDSDRLILELLADLVFIIIVDSATSRGGGRQCTNFMEHILLRQTTSLFTLIGTTYDLSEKVGVSTPGY